MIECKYISNALHEDERVMLYYIIYIYIYIYIYISN